MIGMKRRRASSRFPGEALRCCRRLSRCGKRRVSALHRAQTSLLPKANKPYPNKEEGRNKAEKELAADHEVIMSFGANVKSIRVGSITPLEQACQGRMRETGNGKRKSENKKRVTGTGDGKRSSPSGAYPLPDTRTRTRCPLPDARRPYPLPASRFPLPVARFPAWVQNRAWPTQPQPRSDTQWPIIKTIHYASRMS
jgi:hypothetical protein